MKRTPEQRCRRLAGAQAGVVHRSQAIDCGMSESAISRRTSRGSWTVVLPRVYLLDSGAPTAAAEVRAASLWAGERSALSHRSAAALWGLDVFPVAPPVVTSAKGLTPQGRVRVHRVASFAGRDLARIDGMVVTSPPRTLLDLAATESLEDVEVALDEALRSRLVSVPKLRWFLETHGGHGRRGTATMRRLLDERPRGYRPMESRLERRVWDLLVAAGLPRPVTQYEVFDGGRLVARVDFAYPEALLAVEADGYRWHSGRRTWAHDLARRNRLTALGWRTLHVTHDDVERRPASVVEQVRAMLTDPSFLLQHR